MATLAIEVTKLKSDARCDLRGHLEVALAYEAIKMNVKGNMQMEIRVIGDTEFKYEVKFDV